MNSIETLVPKKLLEYKFCNDFCNNVFAQTTLAFTVMLTQTQKRMKLSSEIIKLLQANTVLCITARSCSTITYHTFFAADAGDDREGALGRERLVQLSVQALLSDVLQPGLRRHEELPQRLTGRAHGLARQARATGGARGMTGCRRARGMTGR